MKGLSLINQLLVVVGKLFCQLPMILTLLLFNKTNEVFAQSKEDTLENTTILANRIDIYRRKSENYQLPNAFVWFENPERRCVQAYIAFSENHKEILRVNGTSNCKDHFFMGRNHIPNALLNHWFHYWPKLYDLEVYMEDTTSKFVFTKTIPVGIADYRAKKGALLVNNQEITLKSVITNLKLDADNLYQLKKHHVNTLFVNDFPDESLVTLADNLGFYIIIDLREKQNGHTIESALMKLQNHPSIACFITNNATTSKAIESKLPNHPIIDQLPINLSLVNLDKISLQEVREMYQPFRVEIKLNCENGINGHTLKIIEKDPFHYRVNTRILSQIDEDLSEKEIISKKVGEAIIENRENCHTGGDLKYTISLLVSKPFSAFDTNDTIAYFTNIQHR